MDAMCLALIPPEFAAVVVPFISCDAHEGVVSYITIVAGLVPQKMHA